ncbi:DNA-processing protein DprA [Phenylobacterium sp. LjRoot164]|uniref:DNA-processing protein DprA n=1 Tax=unclassified Phenylobacterium TaxID=2640670 RepID=UPI003ED01D92
MTTAEYNRLAKDLHQKGQRPADLIKGSRADYVIDARRLDGLLSRGAALSLAMERWEQAGIRVVGRSEPSYPGHFKSKLRSAARPLIFYGGDLALLDREAICVVGSREPTDDGLSFAGRLGAACADQGFVVVSGDARGVDREAMSASLAAGGHAIGVLAEGLSDAVLVKRNRIPMLQGRLLLLSPYDPDARFTVGHAMERNRYLYALAQTAVIVDSDTSGGTWSGAIENLKQNWTPALVRTGGNTRAGNPKLAELGILPIDNSAGPSLTIRDLIDRAANHRAARSPELPFEPPFRVRPQDSEDADELFEIFLLRLRKFLHQQPRSEAEIAAHFKLEAMQVERWLETARRAHGLVRSSDNQVWTDGSRAA